MYLELAPQPVRYFVSLAVDDTVVSVQELLNACPSEAFESLK